MASDKGPYAYEPVPQAPARENPPPYGATSLYPPPEYPAYQQSAEVQAYLLPRAVPQQQLPTGQPQPGVPCQHGTTTTSVCYVVDESSTCPACLGDLLWFVFGGGFLFFVIYGVVGVALCLTIICAPFGIQLLKLAQLSASAFGKEIGRPLHKQDCVHCLGNVLWLPVGLVLSLLHMLFAALACLTIIGIPFAYQHAKLAELALWPFGTEIQAYVSGYQVITTTSMA